jgi:ClpP class serine protease
METKLNEQIERNIQLNRRLGEATAETIFSNVSEGLALTQKEKLVSIAEGVEFEGEQAYREKLITLRESYFPSESANTSNKVETLSEGVGVEGVDVSNSMASYLKALGMANK